MSSSEVWSHWSWRTWSWSHATDGCQVSKKCMEYTISWGFPGAVAHGIASGPGVEDLAAWVPQRCLEKSRGPHIAGIFAIRRVPTVSTLYLWYDVYMCLCSTHTHTCHPNASFSGLPTFHDLPPGRGGDLAKPVGGISDAGPMSVSRGLGGIGPDSMFGWGLGAGGIGHFTTCPSHLSVRPSGRKRVFDV